VRSLGEVVRRGRAHGWSVLIAAARAEAIVRFDADVMPCDGAVAALCDALETGADMSFGVCEPVMRRRNAVSRCAAFAAAIVRASQRGARAAEFAVGRILALRTTAAMAAAPIPVDITNDDHYVSLLVRRNGGRVVHVPAARCRFIVPDTFGDYRRQSARVRAGERQLERLGLLEPVGIADHAAAIGVCAARDPAGAACWVAMYAASLAFAARESPDAEPVIASTKAGFAERGSGGR